MYLESVDIREIRGRDLYFPLIALIYTDVSSIRKHL